MPPLSKRERSIASKFRKYERAREQAKKFYDRADRLLAEIAQEVKRKGVLSTVRIREDGRELRVIDNAAGDSAILGWGHGAVRRWELKVVDP